MNRAPVSAFRPAWWLPGPHLQTVGARLLRGRRGVVLHRERLETPDGDFLDLDFAAVGGLSWEASDPGRPLALVVHGLEGSATSKYACETYWALAREGIRPVGMNFRSCSGEMNRTPRLYHSGETGDLALVVELLAHRFPNAPRAAVGFSLGGNVLLKYLGERGDGARASLDTAVAISVPFDLSAGADKLERGLGPLYAAFFLQKLKRKTRAKVALIDGRCDVRAALSARTMRAFDDAATAPLHGFAGAEDYYRRSSSAQYLDRVRVPTLLIHADDDPFLPSHAVPREAVRSNPHLTAVFSNRGGHVGFVTGRWPWSLTFWAEALAARWVAERLAAPEAARREAAPGHAASPSRGAAAGR